MVNTQGTRRASALSLKSINNKLKDIDAIEESEEDLANKPADAFTEETFLFYWKEFTNNLLSKGEKSTASILSAADPKVDGNIITYPLANKIMEEQFNALRARLMPFLRNKLNNYSIVINIVIAESAAKKVIYTDADKFAQLVEINPDILLLKETFGLEL